MKQTTPPKVFFFVADEQYFLTHRLSLALAALNSGYAVSLITPVVHHGAEIAGHGINVFPLSLDRGGTSVIRELRNILSLARLYWRQKPDIVHHVGLKPVILGSIAATLSRSGQIVNALTGLGYIFHSRERRAALLRLVISPALKFALSRKNSRVILQNPEDLEWVIRCGYAKSKAVRLIRGSGVDPAVYPGGADTAAPLPLIILPARLLRDKGIIEFVEAARLVRRSGLEARFVLVGDVDPANPASLTVGQISMWVKEGIVEAWGWQSDMPAVLARTHIVCLPSYHEGLPRSLLEAAASGCGIVASDIPGCREVVVPGGTGWLVPPRDAQALAHALREAILRPDLRTSYGAAARERVKSNFTNDIVIAATLNVYDDLLQSKSRS